MTASAHQNEQGEWVYPQLYYQDGKPISKKKLLEQIQANQLVQEAIRVEPRIGSLIEQARRQWCVQGYNRLELFYDRFKPRIVTLVGWSASQKALRTTQHYDAVYEAIEDLLPADDVDLYSDGIMPNGMFSPNLQEKYGREYP
jgi:hypothetical protein